MTVGRLKISIFIVVMQLEVSKMKMCRFKLLKSDIIIEIAIIKKVTSIKLKNR